jgi:RNA polymerase sigma factor (sigma-70 family)
MNARTREENLVRQVLVRRILDRRAARWEKRFGGLMRTDELWSVGNEALVSIVREYQEGTSGFEDFCRWRIDIAMLSSIRAEARIKRIDRAAQLASADLLSTFQSELGVSAEDRLRDLARVVAAATFVAEAEEAQHGGEDDLAEREEYALALAVIATVLRALPRDPRRLMVLHFEDGKRLSEVRKILKIHQNTAERWRAQGMAAIRKELDKRGIEHAPGRGGGPRLYVLAGLREAEDERRGGCGDGEEDGEADEER